MNVHNGNGLNIGGEVPGMMFIVNLEEISKLESKEVHRETEEVSNEVEVLVSGKKSFYEMVKYDGTLYDSKEIIDLLGKVHNLSARNVLEKFEGLRTFKEGVVSFTNTWDAIGGYTVMTVHDGLGKSISEYVYSHAGKLFGKPTYGNKK